MRKNLFLMFMTAVMISLFVPGVIKAQMKFTSDFSQSALQVGIGTAVHNKEGVGPCVSLKWHHLMMSYTHTFTEAFSTPGLNVGVYALPFLQDAGRAFNPFVTFDGSFRVRVYGVVDERVIGSENLKLVFAGGPGIGFSAGPVVMSFKIDAGCQYFPTSNPAYEWRVGVKFEVDVFFDQIGTLGGE